MGKQAGGVLVFALVILMASMLIAVTWSSFAHLIYKATVDQEGEERAFQAAEGGIDYVMSLTSGGSCTIGGLDGQTIIGTIDNATFAATVSSGTITSTGWYGRECQRVSGQVSSFWGLLGGPFSYKSNVSHDVNWHGPCGTPPSGGGFSCTPEYTEGFGQGCGYLDNYSGGAWVSVAGAPLFVDCSGDGVRLNSCSGSYGLYKTASAGTPADSIVSVTQVDGSDTGTLASRIQANNSRYELTWGSIFGIKLCKYIGGTLDRCSTSSPSYVVPNGAQVSLRTIGNQVTGLVDGTVVVTFVDDATTSTYPPLTGGGSVGLGVGLGSLGCTGNGLFDDFTVVVL